MPKARIAAKVITTIIALCTRRTASCVRPIERGTVYQGRKMAGSRSLVSSRYGPMSSRTTSVPEMPTASHSTPVGATAGAARHAAAAATHTDARSPAMMKSSAPAATPAVAPVNRDTHTAYAPWPAA